MGSLPTHAELPRLGRVCRLGLATRGDSRLQKDEVLSALERGANYWNWCGADDGMRRAIAEIGSRREQVRVAVQLEARSAEDARRELARYCDELRTDYLDVVTYYYVENEAEWQEILSPGGAAEAMEEARECGQVRAIGLTSHQRPLAAGWLSTGRLDLLMIRYNAAHRGAERDVFPAADAAHLPVVAFTCLRWGKLLERTADDPQDFAVPRAAEWYRFVLAQPGVDVALMAPSDGAELAENLRVLDEPLEVHPQRYAELLAHGDRVRRHAGRFP